MARWRKRRKVEGEKERDYGKKPDTTQAVRSSHQRVASCRGTDQHGLNSDQVLRFGRPCLTTRMKIRRSTDLRRWYDILCHLKTTYFSRFLPNSQNINDLI